MPESALEEKDGNLKRVTGFKELSFLNLGEERFPQYHFTDQT